MSQQSITAISHSNLLHTRGSYGGVGLSARYDFSCLRGDDGSAWRCCSAPSRLSFFNDYITYHHSDQLPICKAGKEDKLSARRCFITTASQRGGGRANLAGGLTQLINQFSYEILTKTVFTSFSQLSCTPK